MYVVTSTTTFPIKLQNNMNGNTQIYEELKKIYNSALIKASLNLHQLFVCINAQKSMTNISLRLHEWNSSQLHQAILHCVRCISQPS